MKSENAMFRAPIGIAALVSLTLLAGCGAMPKKAPEATAEKPVAEKMDKQRDANQEYDEFGNPIDRYRGSEDTLESHSGVGYDQGMTQPQNDDAMEPEHRVYFTYDSELVSEEGRQTLMENARWLQRQSFDEVVVEGHADERGTREYNLALGQKRADAVKSFLVSQGIPPHQVRTITYGKERPLVQGHDDFAYTKNRRADIVLR